MQKHKLIHKYGQFRSDKSYSNEKISDSSSQESDLDELQEVDCNRFFFAEEEEPYSIEDIVDSLGARKEEPMQEEDDSDFSQGYAYFGGSELQRVNANYHRLMCSSTQQEQDLCQTKVRFTQRIHVKFFDLQRPVVQVCDAEQYTTTTFEQYQQTQDDVELSP